MNLDVVLPTYKRSHLLRRALESLYLASIPPDLNVTVIVVDNNSNDDTPQVVAEFSSRSGPAIKYVSELKQGISHARNAGIAAGSGEIVGFIDDDEEIEPSWYSVIAREFVDPSVGFIGGCCLGNWATPAPAWLPPDYKAVIGVVPPKPRSEFGPNFAGNLMGGNAVIRRPVFESVGTYSLKLGRSAKGLLSEEDAEFYGRLQNAGIRGIYVPDLAIYHYIPKERLTREYHRRWVYWRAVSQGMLAREAKGKEKQLLGVPRYKFGKVLRSAVAYLPHRLSHEKVGQSFADELNVWDLFGFIHGKYFARLKKYYSAGG